ncbi:hypothetical protein [Legionella fairfieldensis]|uniref:hypothetical protein n=1 Tax=Legionella fairfieldensis TaxID=45064 RepID=UPI00048B72F2|nr:hypothetical protein [Legionella fairfieldensis]
MLYTEIKQRLYNDLIVPFSALELEKSERKEIIKKIFMGISSEELDVYIKFRKLSDYAGLIKKIFNYYHNEGMQKSSFPEIDFGKNFNYSGNPHLSPRTKGYVEKHSSYHQIQFLIKECFFDYFNPFNKMKLCDPENTVNIEKMTKTVDLKSPAIGNFPTDIEINKRIISFLNYRTNQSWRKTCKSAFFQSAYQPLFFYALGAPVVVAEENNSFNSAQDEYDNLITPKENIQESDLCDSFSSCKNSDDMLLFTSLYQAIEYAQSMRGFGARSNDIRTITPVMGFSMRNLQAI